MIGEKSEEILFDVQKRGSVLLSVRRDDPGAECWATIDMGILRSRISFALGVSIAIALARVSDSTIVDDALMLKRGSALAPDYLFDALKLDTVQPTLEEAAIEFCKGGWYRIQLRRSSNCLSVVVFEFAVAIAVIRMNQSSEPSDVSLLEESNTFSILDFPRPPFNSQSFNLKTLN